MTTIQTEQKIALLHTAAILATISLPNGSPEAQIVTQTERWYQFLQQQALPDETVFTSPPAPAGQTAGPLPVPALAGAVAALTPAELTAFGQAILGLGAKAAPVASVLLPILQGLLGAAPATGPIGLAK